MVFWATRRFIENIFIIILGNILSLNNSTGDNKLDPIKEQKDVASS